MTAQRALALVVLLTAIAGVATTQPRLARITHKVKEEGDVYAFPPPAQLHAATLGWDAAAVDLLWSTLLVEYGTHWAEHRDFLAAPPYVDAILELEPTYAPIYRYVGTLLAYRPMRGTEQDVRLARSYMEQGTVARPNDARLWMEFGQFMAYIAPSFLRSSTDAAAWRMDGARAMGHAVELGADAERALTAADLFGQGGAIREAIPYLERAYAFTEKPELAELHDAIGRKLAALELSAMRDSEDATARAIATRWEHDMPFIPYDWYELVGPVAPTLRCAGLAHADEAACARDWSTMTARGALPGGPSTDEP
jgi:hypothetical protein